MTAPEIAAALGGARRAGQWWSCCCPAHDDRSPSLSLRDGDRGVIVRCWAGCDPRDVLAALRRLGLLGGTAGCGDPSVPVAVPGDDRDDTARRVAAAHRIWATATGAIGTPVARYLAARGISTIPTPSALRYAPALCRPDCTTGSAMVARIDNIDGELIGVHRTWLAHGPHGTWQRRDRAMLGRAAGGAVRLAPEAEMLMVGEGLETCLAAMQATVHSAWAALSTSGLVRLVLPPILRTIVILADHDVNGAGERAARAAAARWLAEGRRVRIVLPPEPGMDFNDVLARGAADSADVAA